MQHPDEGTLHAWLDGELDARHAADIEAHVAQCATCAAAVAEAREFRATSDRLIDVLQPEPAAGPARAGLSPAHTAPGAVRWQRWIAPLATAAVVVLVIQLNRPFARERQVGSGERALQLPAPAAAPVSVTPTDSAAPGAFGNVTTLAEEERLMRENKADDKSAGARAADEQVTLRQDAGDVAALRAPEPTGEQAGVKDAEPGRELRDLPTWKPRAVQEGGGQQPPQGKEIGDLPTWKPKVVPEAAVTPLPSGTLDAAREALGGGALRVIEGLKPATVDVVPATSSSTATVRTVYDNSGTPITLEQRKLSPAEADAARQRAEAPAAPSAAMPRNARRMGKAADNRVTWQEGGYEFVLLGPVSNDSLLVLKAKVK